MRKDPTGLQRQTVQSAGGELLEEFNLPQVCGSIAGIAA
jgi:hypothetical protein